MHIDREFVTSAKKFANFNEFSEIKKIRKNSYKNSSNAWRDALATVINSRKLSDALGNPSTQRKCFYCPIWQITLYFIRHEQLYALLKNKRKETYILNQTHHINRRLTNKLTKPGTFILL